MEVNDPTPPEFAPYDHFNPPQGDGPLPTAPGRGDTGSPDWASYLPEEYRENPQGYFDAQRAREQELEQLRTYSREADAWIQRYEPVVRDPGRRQATPQRQDVGQISQRQTSPPPPNPLEGLDYEDPRSLELGLQRIYDHVNERDQQRQAREEMLAQQIDQRSNDFYNLMTFQQRIAALRNQDLYRHTGYQPTWQEQELVQYMQDHQLQDPDVAYQQMTASSREQSAEQRGYDRARQELTRQQVQGRTTTEQTRGTVPPARHAPVNPYRGYGTNREALQSHVERTTGRRFEW